MKRKNLPKTTGRHYMLIDGSWVKGDRLCGYCKYWRHPGLINDTYEKEKHCRHKYKDGNPCRHYIPFEIHSNPQPIKKPVGDDFRKTL